MRLVVAGKTPSKKNSRNIFVRNGKICNVPSQLYNDWLDGCIDKSGKKVKGSIEQLQDQFAGHKVAEYPIDINIIVYYGTEHRHDLDNALGSIMDALVDAQIIEDDDVKHISQITIQHGGLDRKNPRAEIFLED